jgi:hypothetical protein
MDLNVKDERTVSHRATGEESSVEITVNEAMDLFNETQNAASSHDLGTRPTTPIRILFAHHQSLHYQSDILSSNPTLYHTLTFFQIRSKR